MNFSDVPFTDRARHVLLLAEREAQGLSQECIGTEHVLLGLLREGSGVGVFVLKELCIDLDRIRLQAETLSSKGQSFGKLNPGSLSRTAAVERVIACARREAEDLNHECIGSEHLLLGLLREFDGIAAKILLDAGLQLDQVRSKLRSVLGQHTADGPN